MYQQPRVRIAWPPWPPITRALVIANVVVFILVELNRGRLISILGMVPARFHDPDYLQLWGAVTYMFLHSNLSHLFFNMIGLWMFGSALEEHWGARRFLRFYLLCGVGAGLVYPLYAWNSTVPLVGASGAIYGILAAFGMIWPNRPLYLFAAIPIKAKWLVIGFGLFSAWSMMADRTSNVAHFAHLSGILIGAGYVGAAQRFYRAGRWRYKEAWSLVRTWIQLRKRRARLRVVDPPDKREIPPRDRTLH